MIIPGTRSIFTRNSRHGEVVQHVLRAQQHLDRPCRSPGAAQAPATSIVVLPFRVVRVDAERVFRRYERRIVALRASPSSPGKPVTPRPLLADRLDAGGVPSGTVDELRPDRESPGASIATTPTGSHDRQDPFELLILRLVFGAAARVPCGGGTRYDRVRHEQVHGDEHDAGDPEGQVDRVDPSCDQFDAIGVNHHGLRKWNANVPNTEQDQSTIATAIRLMTSAMRALARQLRAGTALRPC